jgi:hypothetical protein
VSTPVVTSYQVTANLRRQEQALRQVLQECGALGRRLQGLLESIEAFEREHGFTLQPPVEPLDFSTIESHQVPPTETLHRLSELASRARREIRKASSALGKARKEVADVEHLREECRRLRAEWVDLGKDIDDFRHLHGCDPGIEVEDLEFSVLDDYSGRSLNEEVGLLADLAARARREVTRANAALKRASKQAVWDGLEDAIDYALAPVVDSAVEEESPDTSDLDAETATQLIEYLRGLEGDDVQRVLEALEAVAQGDARFSEQLRSDAEQVAVVARQRSDATYAADVIAGVLCNLGYEVDGSFATVAIQGNGQFRRPEWGDNWVRLALEPVTGRIRFEVEGSHDAATASVEHEWCDIRLPQLLESCSETLRLRPEWAATRHRGQQSAEEKQSPRRRPRRGATKGLD